MKARINLSAENRFLLSIAVTFLVFGAELAGGLWSGSLALLSDSAHVFMDIFALGMSYLAVRLSSLPPDDRHTYGYHRLEVLAALANGLTLAGISAGIFWEAYRRWQAPQPVNSGEMLAIAAIGLIANLAVASVLGESGHEHARAAHAARDLNMESARVHVLGDAVSSLGVILAGVLILLTGRFWIDPLVSFLIGILILISSGRVLRSSLHILVEGVPEGISLPRVSESLADLPGVLGIHDLHIWNICSGTVALSAHIVVADQSGESSNRVLQAVNRVLADEYGIEHTTVQFECVACNGNHLAHR